MKRVPPVFVVKTVQAFREWLTRINQKCVPPNVVLMELLCGHWVSQAIATAGRMEIADQLLDGPKTVEELASRHGVDADSLYRLLRALASAGIFKETEARRFALTPLAKPLAKSLPDSMHPLALMMGAAEHWSSWGDLSYSVQSGKPSLERITGLSLFDYLAKYPDKSGQFDAAMTTISRMSAVCIASAYDFSAFRSLVDVGGGQGHLISAILKKFPRLRGTLFDLPQVVAQAAPILSAEGVLARCRIAGGSFFESVIPPSDAYISRNVIHDWDDERATLILSNIRKAMSPGSKLLLAEAVIPAGNRAFFGKFLDLEMLAITPGGRERTADEFATLSSKAGLRVTRTVPTAGYESLVECVAE